MVSVIIYTTTELKENGIEEEEVFGGVPPDLLKRYYCGFGPCRPKWLQVMANKRIFTLLLCLFAFVQGSVVSGKSVHVIRNLLEEGKRCFVFQACAKLIVHSTSVCKMCV